MLGINKKETHGLSDQCLFQCSLGQLEESAYLFNRESTISLSAPIRARVTFSLSLGMVRTSFQDFVSLWGAAAEATIRKKAINTN